MWCPGNCNYCSFPGITHFTDIISVNSKWSCWHCDEFFVCLIWLFTSHQQSFSYKGTGLLRFNQYQARINVPCSRTQRSDIVTGATKLVSINALLTETHWEILSSRWKKHKLILFYKMKNNLYPSYHASIHGHWSISAHQRNAIRLVLRWWADSGPLLYAY